MLDTLKETVYHLHLELPKYNLVAWTGGNVSARDPESNLVVIKPSGVLYEKLRPEDHVVVNLDGDVVEGKLKPSSDTLSHLYIYRHRPDVNGVVHTHSPYATAFAAVGEPIPVCLTAIADEFGGPVPCAGFALIGGEDIGKQVVENPGQFPFQYAVTYNAEDIDPRFTYAVSVRITDSSGNLIYINTSAYNVITNDNPSMVDVLVDPV